MPASRTWHQIIIIGRWESVTRMEFDLSGQTALLSGSGRGMGKASATELARNGADVVINDIDEGRGRTDSGRIRDLGVDALGIAADVSDEAEVAAMVERATDELGAIDIPVNNAGVGDAGPFLDDRYDHTFDLNLDVHLHGALNCTRGRRRDGRAGVRQDSQLHLDSHENGVGMSPAYDVAKYSLLGLTKSPALELGREGSASTPLPRAGRTLG